MGYRGKDVAREAYMGKSRPSKPEHSYHQIRVRRAFAAAASIFITALLSYLALRTAVGQSIDTVLMESMITLERPFSPIEVLLRILITKPLLVFLAVAVGAIALLRSRPALAGRMIVAVLGANITTQLLKYFLSRADLGVTTYVVNSLPSGHATFVMSVGLAAIVVVPHRWRVACMCLTWAVVSIVGLTVMASAWHRPSDLLSAYLISEAWVLASAPVEAGVKRWKRFPSVVKCVCVSMILASWLFLCAGVAGNDLSAISVPGASGYGFKEFIDTHSFSALALQFSAGLGVVGFPGLLIREVDRLHTD